MSRDFKDISGPDMAVWCEMLADDNAIHLSREAAEAAGFGPRRVNPGPANLAYLMSLVGEDIAHVDARYSGNVFEGDDLTARVLREGDPTETQLLRGDDVVVSATFISRKDRP